MLLVLARHHLLGRKPKANIHAMSLQQSSIWSRMHKYFYLVQLDLFLSNIKFCNEETNGIHWWRWIEPLNKFSFMLCQPFPIQAIFFSELEEQISVSCVWSWNLDCIHYRRNICPAWTKIKVLRMHPENNPDQLVDWKLLDYQQVHELS
jgi:hypothetical protein